MGMFGNLGLQDAASFLHPQQSPMNGSIPVIQGVGGSSKPGFFSAQGGWRNILGAIGDGLSVAGGGQPYYMAQQRWLQQQAAEQAQREQERQDRLNTPSILNIKAGVMSATPAGETKMLYEAPPEAPDVPDWQTYVTWANDPARTPAELAAARDYVLKGNGPTAMGYRTELKTTAPGKAPSVGGGGGGSKLTATARARYIAEAQSAIQRGADPAKVHARLKEMGVE